MPRKQKIVIDELLKNQLNGLLIGFKPKFGCQNDIDILEYLRRLNLKANSAEEVNSLTSKCIYLLKNKPLF